MPGPLANACLRRLTALCPQSPVLTLDSDLMVHRKNERQVIQALRPDSWCIHVCPELGAARRSRNNLIPDSPVVTDQQVDGRCVGQAVYAAACVNPRELKTPVNHRKKGPYQYGKAFFTSTKAQLVLRHRPVERSPSTTIKLDDSGRILAASVMASPGTRLVSVPSKGRI